MALCISYLWVCRWLNNQVLAPSQIKIDQNSPYVKLFSDLYCLHCFYMTIMQILVTSRFCEKPPSILNKSARVILASLVFNFSFHIGSLHLNWSTSGGYKGCISHKATLINISQILLSNKQLHQSRLHVSWLAQVWICEGNHVISCLKKSRAYLCPT